MSSVPTGADSGCPTRPTTRLHRVLVIDGHAAVRSTLTGALAALGCETLTARDGEEALAHVRAPSGDGEGGRRRRIDLVIMDLVLPRTNGLDLLRQLPREFAQAPPVVVLGALREPRAIEELFALGACDYIPKPFDLDVLLYKVSSLLGEPAHAPFHWVPLPAAPAVAVDGHAGTATAVSETGLVVLLAVGVPLARRQPVPVEAAFFVRQFGVPRCCAARVVNVTAVGGQSLVELAFVALPEGELHKIRAFAMRH